MFDENGEPVSDAFGVNISLGNAQYLAKVAGLQHGGFVVTWTDTSDQSGGVVIRGQRFDDSGTRAGAEFVVLAGTFGYTGSLTALPDGGFLVVAGAGRREQVTEDGFTRTLHETQARFFGQSGQAVGAAMPIDPLGEHRAGFGGDAAVLADGTIVAVLTSTVYEGTGPRTCNLARLLRQVGSAGARSSN